MSDTTTAEPAEPACLVCADGPEECRSCDGAGEDPGGYGSCSTCGGTGAAIPDHCCDCGGSPYCMKCHTCGAPCAGSCQCRITVKLQDGRELELPPPDPDDEAYWARKAAQEDRGRPEPDPTDYGY